MNINEIKINDNFFIVTSEEGNVRFIHNDNQNEVIEEILLLENILEETKDKKNVNLELLKTYKKHLNLNIYLDILILIIFIALIPHSLILAFLSAIIIKTLNVCALKNLDGTYLNLPKLIFNLQEKNIYYDERIKKLENVLEEKKELSSFHEIPFNKIEDRVVDVRITQEEESIVVPSKLNVLKLSLTKTNNSK